MEQRQNAGTGPISIHAPRGGSDSSTICRSSPGRISIHAPRGGSDRYYPSFLTSQSISIHAPRGGSDHRQEQTHGGGKLFQSTLPVGGATVTPPDASVQRPISIHAPRGGSDAVAACSSATASYFNPRSPWGERQPCGTSDRQKKVFQSTLPVGGATRHGPSLLKVEIISIHAPRGGSDPFIVPLKLDSKTFQSTLPVGGATQVDGFL